MKKTVALIGVAALVLGVLAIAGSVAAQGKPDFKTIQAPARPEPRGPVVNPQKDPPVREVYAPVRPSMEAEP